MLECAQCKLLLHAKCEEISDEQYEILSYLPEQVAFVCKACTKTTENRFSWKDIVNMELKNQYHNILRIFSKNNLVRKLFQSYSHIICTCPENSSKKIISGELDVDKNEIKIKQIESNESLPYNKKSNRKLVDSEVQQNTEKKPESKVNDLQENNVKNSKHKIILKDCSVQLKKCIDSNIPTKNDDNENKLTETTNETIISLYNDKDVYKVLHDIKNKINTNFFINIKHFHEDINKVLENKSQNELSNVFNSILKDMFPWYKTAALEQTFADNNCQQSVETSNSIINKSKPTQKSGEQVFKRFVYHDNTVLDSRQCVLCKTIGDSKSSAEGRLLSCALNEWIHINCAFWSSEVFEQIDGCLQNVSTAIRRSNLTECVVCRQKGATVNCSVQSCKQTFHYLCARNSDCFFMHNKTVYCSSHSDKLTYRLESDSEFEILRPIFIKLDSKKKEYVDPVNVHYLVGALTVLNLGVFYPSLSDTEEAIITSDFLCTRLFWSTVEPWKIVQYKISTSVCLPQMQKLDTEDKYFVVDYSLNKEIIDRQLKEIEEWKKELEYGKNKEKKIIANNIKYSMSNSNDEKIVTQVLDYLLEIICNKEMEENCEDEPQNTTDILPPELKDAIFEDLPHDLLDGISMQDIFPKLMSYEDVLMDIKNSDLNDSNDFLKESKNELNSDIMNNLDSDEFLQLKYKKSDMYVGDGDFWLEPKCSIPNDDNIQNCKVSQNINNAELKRSKSEVFSGIKKITRNRNHQRSCSLTWSCKLDNSFTSNIKKRKVSSASKNVTDISSNLFMVVDSSNEKGSMLQELRLPESVLMSVGRSTNSDCAGETVREFKYKLEENSIVPSDKIKANMQQLELGKENKCRTWQNRSRLLQVDGADDLSSSDGESQEGDTFKELADEPVKCDRCQCTYRTHTSYKRHLSTCDFISTSDSDSEESVNNDFAQTVVTINVEQKDESSSVERSKSADIKDNLQDDIPKVQVTITPKLQKNLSKPEYSISCNIFTGNTLEIDQKIDKKVDETVSMHLTGTKLNSVETVSNIDSTLNRTVHPSPVVCNISETEQQPNLENSHNTNPVILNNTANALSSAQDLNISKENISVVSSLNTSVKPQIVTVAKEKPKHIAFKKSVGSTRGRGRSVRGTTVKRLRSDNPVQVMTQVSPNGIIQMPQNFPNSNPTIVIQQMPSPSLVPTYIDTFQQHTGQNLQCIAALVPNDYKPSTYVAQNNVVPGLYQLQSSESSNLITVPNNSISIIPSLQISQPPQTVMGTLIPQPRSATTIQCGMMTEQLVLGSLPTVETLMTDTSGSLFLAAPQPVYYGFETIVQNTIMQSQQFLSTTAVPGVLSNSSYSATTTQVFQASKIEPVVEMNSNGYIIVNPSVPQIATPVPNNSQSVINIMQNKTNVYPAQTVAEPQPLVPIQSTQITETPVQTVESIPVKIEQVSPPQPVIYPQEQVLTEVKPQVSPPRLQTASTLPEPIMELTPPPKTLLPPKPLLPPKSLLPSKPLLPPKPIPSVNGPLVINSITLPVAPYSTDNSIPMNIVNPTPQVNLPPTTTSISRPMSRVLPMQTNLQREFPKPKSPPSKVLAIEPPDILNRLSETVDKIQETLNNETDSVLNSKNNSSDNQMLKLESASLKLVFQKQSQDGIYKISNKYISKSNMPLQLSPAKPNKAKEVEVIKNVRTNIQPKKEKPVETQEMKKAPDQSRENKNPFILYKIQSQDGFNQSASSLTDLWEKLFDAVQKARVAHNMPLLPQNAFDMINGLQLMGLKSNGLRYIMEQLPGAARCMKYKPGFHKERKQVDHLSEDDVSSQGAVRCIPHKFHEQPYDMFSWLASKHRKPDYSIQIEPDISSR